MLKDFHCASPIPSSVLSLAYINQRWYVQHYFFYAFPLHPFQILMGTGDMYVYAFHSNKRKVSPIWKDHNPFMFCENVVNVHCGFEQLWTARVKYTLQNNTDRFKEDLTPKKTIASTINWKQFLWRKSCWKKSSLYRKYACFVCLWYTYLSSSLNF